MMPANGTAEESGLTRTRAETGSDVPDAARMWGDFLWLPLLVSLALLILPQASFVWMSFHRDLGMGQVSDHLTLNNYAALLTDPFYLRSMWLTTYLAAGASLIGILIAFPTAYSLARLGTWVATLSLSVILATSLITIVIKLMGLNLILGPSGILNQFLLATGLVGTPVELINNRTGVLIGLVQYTLPILILLFFGVAQTIPVKLEEAAEIHGATRSATFFQVVVPLARQGLVSGGLIAFNMCMGAFTSPLILGGGRVLTVPVLIQQKMIADTEYGIGATLSVILLIFVFVLNLVGGGYLLRAQRRPARARP